MLSLKHYVLCILFYTANAKFGVPELRVLKGPVDISVLPDDEFIISQYVIGETYTFEVYLDETTQHDYLIDSCFMNSEQVIGPYGCVDCGNCISKSVETESYNKPGAVKRTLIEFVARQTSYKFQCSIKKYFCSGCAERSCQRQNLIPWDHFQSSTVSLMYPPAGYISPPIGVTGVWPWWVWLLIILLLLLLLCCLLALCFAAFMRRRKEKKAVTTVTVVDGKDCAVGTDRVSVTCVGTDTQDIVKVQPAVVLGAESLNQQQHHQYSRKNAEYDQGSVMAGGSYSLREGMVHEGYTRTIPEHYSTHDRYASRERFDRHNQDKYTDRSSYRNFGYERDMGRVEPLDGFDEVETRERTYCLSDDDQEIVEKNVKRTHTTRYLTESREYEQEHDHEEKMREDEYHHASYTHSLPV